MESDEREATQVCAQCGSNVVESAERGFEFGTENLLCWSCAMRRGGHYDAELDEWTVAPDVADLPDEAYGSSPHEMRRVPK